MSILFDRFVVYLFRRCIDGATVCSRIRLGLYGLISLAGGQGGGEPGLHVGFVLAGGHGGGEPGLHVGFVLAGGQGGGEPGLHVGGGTGLQLGLIEPGWQGGRWNWFAVGIDRAWLARR